MANELTLWPRIQNWIPECTVIENTHFKIEIIDEVRTELGLSFYKMQMRLLEPPKWCKKTEFHFIVGSTLRARRCKVGNVVKIKSMATFDSRLHFIHEIVET